jgi:multisubunit Na+/H+ antiporter MnhC subunit
MNLVIREGVYPMPVLSMVFFAAFALIVVGTYVAVRRGMGNIRVIAAMCMVGSIITMMLSQITRVTNGGNAFAAGLIGAGVGAIGGASVLALAWYFHMQELRQQRE